MQAEKIDFKSKIKKKYNFQDRDAFGFCYLMLLLPVITLLVFWLYINLDSILIAFKDANGKITFDNFKMVWQGFVDKDIYGWSLKDTLGRTVLMWFLISVVGLVPSMFSSYVLYRKIPGAFVFRLVFVIPMVLSGLIWTMVMKYLVGLDGPVMSLLSALGVNLPEEVFYNGLLGCSQTAFATIVIITLVPTFIGFNIVTTGAFTRIPTDLFEVGKIEGIGFIKEFFKIAVPLIWPTLVITVISSLSGIFSYEGGVFLYTMGTYDTQTMGFYLYYLVFLIAGNADAQTPFYGYASAVGLTLTLMTIPIVLFGKIVLERAVETVEY